MKIKQFIKENLFILMIFIWLIAILGYIILWWNVLPVTIRTGLILLGLLMGIPILIIGIIKKLEFAYYFLTFIVCLAIILFLAAIVTGVDGARGWRVRNLVLAYERTLDFNRNQLESRIEDRPFRRSHSRSWFDGGYVSLTVMTPPNYRFTKKQLEELSLIAHEIENLYGDAHFRYSEDIIWIRYSMDNYWLRTYHVEKAPLTMTRDAGLSTIYGVEENIAVIEVRFPRWMTPEVLRLPLVDQHGELHGENFALALQLHQLMLSELFEDTEETRPFELAREVFTELGGR